MGTINYGTGDFITAGLNIDSCVMENGGTDYDEMDIIRDNVEGLFDNSPARFNSIYTVKIESGYYEGFYITISDEYVYFDDEEERAEALEELKKAFDFLSLAIDNGLCVVYPSWCTSYDNYEESKESLKQAYLAAVDSCKNKPDYEHYILTDEYKKMFERGVKA